MMKELKMTWNMEQESMNHHHQMTFIIKHLSNHANNNLPRIKLGININHRNFINHNIFSQKGIKSNCENFELKSQIP